MGNILRIEFNDAIYHVISRGVARMKTYIDKKDYLDFLKRLAVLAEDGGIVVYAWCLMPNHFHLLARTPHGQLSRWMRSLIGSYAQSFNRRYDRVGHVWQGRHKAILVEDGSYLVDCSRYIHLNPCRSKQVGNVNLPENYTWSSYHDYIGRSQQPRIVDASHILSFFSNSPKGNARSNYKLYVEKGLLEDGDNLDVNFERASVVCGSRAFKMKIGRIVSPKINSSSNGYSVAKTLLSNLELTPEAICSIADEKRNDILFMRRRRIKMFLLQKLTLLSNKEIATHLGVHPTTVGKASSMIHAEMANDVEFRSKILSLIQQIRTRTLSLNYKEL